ncbi:MAG: hypothetical protein KGK33_06890 [Hyphomicrobiales bacterium]|nr:hypothetical protein [Hyphomicrobiales bacterium]
MAGSQNDGPWLQYQNLPPLPPDYQLEDGSPWNDFRVSDSPQAVQINATAIKHARNLGFSDDQIASHLAEKYPTLLLDHLSGATQQTPPDTPAATAPQSGPLMFDSLPKGPPAFDDLPVTPQALPPLPEGYVLDGPWRDFQNQGAVQNKDIPQNAPVTASGLTKATAAGALSGTVGIPGDVVSLINLARKGYNNLLGNGLYDEKKDNYSLGQGYENLRKAADQIYQPKNTAEDWAKTAGEFIPALVTGPEGILEDGAIGAAKVLAKRAITQAAIPAAASSAAGAATQGTELEPYARVGAALLAGGLGTRGAKPTPVTSDAIGAVADKNFSDFRSAPVTIKPDVVENAAKGIQSDLASSGLSKAPANDYVGQYIGNSNPVSLNQLQETRSLLAKAASRSDTPEGVAAIRAKKGIDALMDSLQPSDTVVGGNALPAAMDALRQGRANSAVASQLEAIEGKQYRGELNAEASHVGDATDNALRQQIKSLLASKQVMNRLGAYRSQMEQIVHGGPVLNALRRAGQLTSGHNSFLLPLMLGETALSPTGGLATAGLLYGGGAVMRKLAARTTGNRIDALKAKIAGNAQGLPQQAPAYNPLLMRALIASQAANGAQ